jgi:hypothetical protein
LTTDVDVPTVEMPAVSPARAGGKGVRMTEEQNRQVVDEFGQALESGDVERLGIVFDKYTADDFVQEWPQSGEVIRGKANAMEINRNYPGMPSMKMRGVRGAGDVWVAEVTLDYGQGPVHGVSIFEFRDGQVVKETDYFADPFEAPEWRSQWVERTS